MSVARTDMKTVKAIHSQVTALTWPRVVPPSSSQSPAAWTREHDREVGDEGHEHRARKPPAVPRADEDAVDDEDEARERLAQGHDDEATGDGRLHRRVGREQRSDDGPEEEDEHAEDDADDHPPPQHERRRLAGARRPHRLRAPCR